MARLAESRKLRCITHADGCSDRPAGGLLLDALYFYNFPDRNMEIINQRPRMVAKP